MIEIIENNKLHLRGNNLERVNSFLNEYGKVENSDYTASVKMGYQINEDDTPKEYQFFTLEDTNYYTLTRGLKKDLLNFLDINNIQYTYKEDFEVNEPINITSKIEKLREYQLDLEKELDNSTNGYILVPTGGGKTVVMINEIAKNKQKTILLIHNTKLLYQFIERLKNFSDISEDDIGIYGDGKKEIKPITIALMQSFGKLGEKKIQEITSKFDLFLIDEGHHLVAKTFIKISSNVKSKRFYGLTATPYKKDGTAKLFLEKLIGPLLYEVTEQTLQAHKVILKPHLVPVVNKNSYIRDMYNDFFKLEDWKVHKYYVDQFKDIPFTSDYISNKDNETTLVVGESTRDIINFFNNLPQKIQNQGKLMLGPIFKKSQKVLENYKLVVSLDTPEQYRRIDMNKIKKQFYYDSKRINLIYACINHEFKNNKNKDPNILILSDQVDHLEYMYQNLPEGLKKYACLLHGKMKKKESDEVDLKITKKEYRIIFATDKFVGEGWDQSHLDILIMTHLMKDHEGLKQLVGRVIRSSNKKEYATVYDIVDINCPITFNQFKKRYLNYYIKQASTNAIIDFVNRKITFRK